MPMYEYACGACEARFEQIVSRSAADDMVCARCGSTSVRRLLSVIAGVGGRSGPEVAPAPSCGGGACGNC
jgi:putative FmdB family regulatory protein